MQAPMVSSNVTDNIKSSRAVYRITNFLASGQNGKVYLAVVVQVSAEFELRPSDTVVIKLRKINESESKVLQRLHKDRNHSRFTA